MEITQKALPLKKDADGVVRVGGTRIPLDTVVVAFQRGATAEEIMQQYPSLALSDVYAAISFYLDNENEVEVYLRYRRVDSHNVKKENEARFDLRHVRKRLLSRKASQA